MTLAVEAQYSLDNNLAKEKDEEVAIELDSPENGEEILFILPNIPGAEDDEDIIVDEPVEIEVSAPEDVEVEESDPWDWHSGGLSNFLNWLHGMIVNCPRHTGRDTTGLEKAIAYFELLDKEITKAMRQDYRNEIDSAKAEEARAQIENGLERLLDRLDKVRSAKYKRHNKKNKKSWVEAVGLVKEAQKATHVNGIVVTVPLLISRLARICINGMVSGGHDIEDTFSKLSKKYNLTNREQAELMQLLADMNYPVRRDRGFDLDEEYNITSSDNYDFAANFPD